MTKCDKMLQVWSDATSVTNYDKCEKPERCDNTWSKRQNVTGVKTCDEIEQKHNKFGKIPQARQNVKSVKNMKHVTKCDKT